MIEERERESDNHGHPGSAGGSGFVRRCCEVEAKVQNQGRSFGLSAKKNHLTREPSPAAEMLRVMLRPSADGHTSEDTRGF